MWHNNLDKNHFIMKLYDNVPSIIDIRIAEIKIHNEGDTISLIFDMPLFADHPPKKWIDAKYNTVIVRIDLFDVEAMELKSYNKTYRGDINITKEKDNIIVNIEGSIKGRIIASAGIIQSVEAYCNESLSKM